MKKILVSIIITFGLIQAEEWIYYSSSDYYSDSAGVYRVSVDGSENELVMEGVFLRDLSYDKSKLLVTDNSANSVSIVDIETMNIQTMAFADISPQNLHFTNDENVIIFTDNYYDLYKYSFIDNSLTFIDTGSNTENYKFSMSPNGEKAVFLKNSVQGFFPFEENTVDIVTVDFLTDEVSILQTLSTSEHECVYAFSLMGISYRTYWGADDYIYFSICETSESFQFLKINSTYGDAVQLLENEFFYSLGLKSYGVEKIIFSGLSSTSPYGIFDIESNEASYYENIYVEIEFDMGIFGIEYRPIQWLYQVWSPDNSKVALNGSVFLGGTFGNNAPVAIHIFDTVTGNITQILPDDFSDNYSVGPMFWVGESEVSIVEPSDNLPEQFVLYPNYPNPFNPTTTLRYDLPEDAQVRILIYDLMGHEVKSLMNQQQTAGFKSVVWDATNELGQPVSAGMYLYRVSAGDFHSVKKMVLLK